MKAQIFTIWALALTCGQASALPNPDYSEELELLPRDLNDEDHDHDCKNDEPQFKAASVAEGIDESDWNLFERDYDLLTAVPTNIVSASESVQVTVKAVATGTAQILPSLTGDITPHTTGFVLTSLNATGRPTENILMTSSIPSPISLLEPEYTSLSESKSSTTTTKALTTSAPSLAGSRLFKMAVNDIFADPIGTALPPSQITTRSDHPVPRTGINQKYPIETNKFYANFFLSDQLSPTFTHPYSLAWAGGTGSSASWGLSISHIRASQRVYGDVEYNNAAAYFINPIGIQSMVISAKELGNTTVLTTDSLTQFSARVMLAKKAGATPAVWFPIVQGMAYVTAEYNGAVPLIQSGVYFKTMTRVTKNPKTNVVKYNFVLEDGTTWRVYAYRTKGAPLTLTVVNNGLAESKYPFYGYIQVTKDPKTSGSEALLDNGAGVFPTTMTMTGSVSGTTGSYWFTFARAGHPSGALYMYALPHHVASFNDDTTSRVKKNVKLQTTTKGVATLVQGYRWGMVEKGMKNGIGFPPWHPTKGPMKTLSAKAKAIIKPIAHSEISQDISAQTDLNSVYYSGKALAKFGMILYVINDMLGETALAAAGLKKLKAAFALFQKNQEIYPLVYEKAWGGIVSSASYTTGDSGSDFGNTYYNDHHFHYGYHILAAAYIGHIDPTWVAANKAYVNSLCRDIANPSTEDPYFPQYRMFDWFHGHSWAHGLFAAWDGKDQESSSEDAMSAFALKMWGIVSKNTAMTSRANLQLAVLARSLQSYYLYKNANTIQPSNFIGNKVAGILFENKIDHTTYFSPLIEAIQGIHMIPIIPTTAYIRPQAFVQQEWNVFFNDGRINDIDDAWRGIIWGSYATVAPKQAWNFFSQDNFNSTYIDGGASLTWFLAYSAALGSI